MSSATSFECDICCDKRYYGVTCLYCQKKACMTCSETYILDNPSARCMFCKNNWNTEFLQKNFSGSFMNKKYKEHLKTVIYDRERALFPETQADIENDKKKEGYLKQIKEKKEQMKKLKEEIMELELAMNGKKKEEKRAVVYSIPCSQNGCRGFLNGQSVCGICNKKHCSKCRVAPENLDEHKCDPNTLETIKMLEKETKPCPKCFTPISKISGCDQMWCTQCKTAFSWKTGMIETGHVHNPHYWQYLQKEGRDLDQVRAMNGQRPRNCDNILEDISYDFDEINLKELCRLFMHIRHIEIPNFNTVNYVEANLELRKEFLTNKIDEKQFKKTLHMRQKKNEYKDEMRQIAQMFHDVGRDILKKYHEKLVKDKRTNKLLEADKNALIEEVKNLSIYVKEQIKTVCDRYDYKEPSSFSVYTGRIYKTATGKSM